VTADAFAPATIGAAAAPRRALHTLLVTGDSLSTPLDLELGRRLAGRGVRVLRDPHLGTGISKSDIVDWGRLSVTQTSADHPDAVIVFIGANEGFPMPGATGAQVQCCSAGWAAIYANRTRQLMNHLPTRAAPRACTGSRSDPAGGRARQIERVVNGGDRCRRTALARSGQGDRHGRDLYAGREVPAPRWRSRASRRSCAKSDGIHLNLAGSGLLAGIVLAI